MLGLSVSKILLLILVIVVLWRGARLLGYLREQLAGDPQGAPARNRPQRPDPPGRAQELFECPKCGTFVPNGTFCPSKEDCRLRRA